jgi:putative transcriptional regulator
MEDQITAEGSRAKSASRRGGQDRSLRRRHGDLRGVTAMKKKGSYKYTESGLDNVYLVSGYEYADGGKTVIIRDIDGLHRAIGEVLAKQRYRLTGDEFRFLRSELLLSQASLAKVLGVKELTIGRWERGESEIPVPAEVVVRMMFLQNLGEKGAEIKKLCERIADLEDEMDRQTLKMREIRGRWNVLEPEPEPEAA